MKLITVKKVFQNVTFITLKTNHYSLLLKMLNTVYSSVI